MSEIRTVELNVDREVFEECAKRLGYKIRHDDYVYGYSTKGIKCPLVVDVASGISIGIDNGRVVYDDWKDIAKNAMSGIMKEYMKTKLKGMKYKIKETEKRITISVRR